MQQVAVVIPLYKSTINSFEQASLEACKQHLLGYPIRLIGPKNLNYQPYLQFFKNAKDISTITFPNHFFKSIQGYNRLMLSSSFYKVFKQFKYILIYQTDAFVFKDDLEYWCSQNYDYIGAPWFSEVNNKEGVGNGGFSLRKTKTMLKVLETPFLKRFVYNPKNDVYYKAGQANMIRLYKKNKWIRLLINKLNLNILFLGLSKLPILKRNPLYLSRIYVFYEDLFWSKLAKYFYPKIQIPNTQTGLQFSFELLPEKCYHLNNNTLPFGCHAWMKRGNHIFWKKHIPILQE